MKNQEASGKIQLVVGIHPRSYRITEPRLNKPVCIVKLSQGIETGSMLLQDIDDVLIRGNRLTYFTPNNIAILLSVSNKSLELARNINQSRLDPSKAELNFQNTNEDKRSFLDAKSKDVCDYIEAVMTSIIFGYTAVETFSNLSIPTNYIYQGKITKRNVKEPVSKDKIERWFTLKEKVLHILPSIYKTTPPNKQKFWTHFVNLEKYRHNIIHQKTITSTDFYKYYFRSDIFNICTSAEEVIGFFYDYVGKDNKTNPLWPWLNNRKTYYPISYDFDASKFEVIGNIYEGYRLKPKS